MKEPLESLIDGTVTSPTGFSAGAVFAGLKNAGLDRRDLGILCSDRPAEVAGTFTQNSVISPSAVLSREVVASGAPVRGIVVNSGCANCAVGAHGLTDAREVVLLAATKLGVRATEMLICSTGVIGVELPMGIIREHLPRIKPDGQGGSEFARAIMTTDTRVKQLAVKFTVDGKEVTLGGAAKGSGMIHPNMATMLAFMTTDADVERDFLRQVLSETVEVTFNQIDVDNDTSTNDSVLLLANGAAGNRPIDHDHPDAPSFIQALNHVSRYLAKEIARDGEGATRLIEVVVEGAGSDQDARSAALSVASSMLVKAAVHGRDPNWGRIMMAVGKTGIELDESKIDIFVNDIQIVESGTAIPFFTQSVVAVLGESEVCLRVCLNDGDGQGLAWGCDLSEEYVVFNSAYTT